MALRLLPFRQYSDYDVINLFASNTADTDPSTNGDGSQGVFVKVSVGNLDADPITYATNGYLGKTDYPFIGVAQYPEVPLKFVAATTGAPVLGITLNQTLQQDENGEKLLYNPTKAAELQAVLSGQACPVATRGTFTLSDSAIEWADSSMTPNNHLVMSTTAGKVSGLASSSSDALSGQYTILGRILGTGQRVSQIGESDQFAGTTTGKYALVQIDCVNPTAL